MGGGGGRKRLSHPEGGGGGGHNKFWGSFNTAISFNHNGGGRAQKVPTL